MTQDSVTLLIAGAILGILFYVLIAVIVAAIYMNIEMRNSEKDFMEKYEAIKKMVKK